MDGHPGEDMDAGEGAGAPSSETPGATICGVRTLRATDNRGGFEPALRRAGAL